MLRVDWAEAPLALAEHHRYDVHCNLVQEAERECLPADVPGADGDHTVSVYLWHLLSTRGWSGEAYEEWVGELMCTSTLRAVRAGNRSARKGVALGHTED